MQPELPHSLEAEQQVIGSALLDNRLIDAITEFLKPEDFYEGTHGLIWEAIVARAAQGRTVSPVSIGGVLAPILAPLGGPSYLAKIAGLSFPEGAVDLSKEIAGLALRRRLVELGQDVAATAIVIDREPSDVLGMADTEIAKLAESATFSAKHRSMLSVARSSVEQINAINSGQATPGIPTGIAALDDIIKGMRGGQFILLGGRPAMGKTSVALHIIRNVAMAGHGVMHFSLEMNGEEVFPRLISMGLRERGITVPYQQLDSGGIDEKAFREILAESERLSELPIRVAERHARTPGEIRLQSRLAQRFFADSTPLGLIVIDYLQLVSGDGRSVYERASAVSDLGKSLAMELNVPVLACAQLSRELERRTDKRPMLADLRESGKLEEDADKVIFCYRPEYYVQQKVADAETLEERADLESALASVRNQLELIVSKQRNGPTGTARAFIDLPTCSVLDRAPSREGELF